MTATPVLTPEAALLFIVIALVVAALVFKRSWRGPAAVMITAPFAWYHQLGPTEISVSKAAFAGAVLGFGVGIAIDRDRRARALAALRSNPAVWLLAAFAALSAASALWAGAPADAARDGLKWIWYAGVFGLSVVSCENPRDALNVAVAFFVSAAGVGLFGLWQNVTASPAAFVAGNGAVVGRIVATLEGPNQFGSYLETVIPLLLAVLLFARIGRVAFIAASLLLGLLVSDLLLSYSRGALWSCAAAVAFVAAAYIFASRSGAARAYVAPPRALALAAVCAAIVMVPIAHYSITPIGWQHEMWAAGFGDTTDSAAYRRRLWSCASILIQRHPLAGVGAGNFADAKDSCGAGLTVPEHANANEWYLETAADLGLAGLTLLGAFLATLFVSWRREAMWGDPVVIGAYAVLVAFTLHGFVDDVMTYPKAALAFFALVGLLAANRPPR